MKFVYSIPDKGSDLILIYTLKHAKRNSIQHVVDENKLVECIKKFPDCCSFAMDKESETEEKRLLEKYGLKIL